MLNFIAMSTGTQYFKDQFQQGWALRNKGRYDEMFTLAGEQLARARQADDKASEALFLKLHAQAHHDQGELREALKHYKEIEHIYIVLKDKARQMHTLRHIGNLYLDLEEFECAEKCLVQVMDFIGDRIDMEAANTFRIYALALAGLNEESRSMDFWRKARDIYQAHGIEEGVAECDSHLTTDC